MLNKIIINIGGVIEGTVVNEKINTNLHFTPVEDLPQIINFDLSGFDRIYINSIELIEREAGDEIEQAKNVIINSIYKMIINEGISTFTTIENLIEVMVQLTNMEA